MLTWIATHLDQLLSTLTSIVAAASAIAALTPTPRDDGIVATVRKVIDVLALNVVNARGNGAK